MIYNNQVVLKAFVLTRSQKTQEKLDLNHQEFTYIQNRLIYCNYLCITCTSNFGLPNSGK